jgi:hypothetical protein
VDGWTIGEFLHFYLFDSSFAPPFGFFLSILLGLLVATIAGLPQQDVSRLGLMRFLLFRILIPAILLGAVAWPVGAFLGLIWFFLSGGGF